MLQSVLLVDEGVNDLAYKHQELKKIIDQEMKNIDSLAGEPSLMTDEKFVNLAMQNKGQHAKAKLIIHDLLEKIAVQERKNSNKKAGQAKD